MNAPNLPSVATLHIKNTITSLVNTRLIAEPHSEAVIALLRMHDA